MFPKDVRYAIIFYNAFFDLLIYITMLPRVILVPIILGTFIFKQKAYM